MYSRKSKENKKFVLTIQLIIFLSFLLFESCSNKLLRPISPNHSKVELKPPISDFKGEKPTTIYLEPTDDLRVKASEKCKILSVSVTNDSSIIIVATGHNNIAYGRLAKCFVTKGSVIPQGYLIGELFSKDSVFDNSLELVIEKNGKYKFPKW